MSNDVTDVNNKSHQFFSKIYLVSTCFYRESERFLLFSRRCDSRIQMWNFIRPVRYRTLRYHAECKLNLNRFVLIKKNDKICQNTIQ